LSIFFSIRPYHTMLANTSFPCRPYSGKKVARSVEDHAAWVSSTALVSLRYLLHESRCGGLLSKVRPAVGNVSIAPTRISTRVWVCIRLKCGEAERMRGSVRRILRARRPESKLGQRPRTWMVNKDCGVRPQCPAGSGLSSGSGDGDSLPPSDLPTRRHRCWLQASS
jgi:hypothetical protein